jgi:hypothetical protein
MSWLHYANQSGTGDWAYACGNAMHQLRPYEGFLKRAIQRAKDKAHALGWTQASPRDARELSKRARRNVPKGAVWLMLESLPDRTDDFDEALASFMSRDTKQVHDQPRCWRDDAVDVLYRDQDAAAILVEHAPRAWLERTDAGERQRQVLFLRVDTHTLKSQKDAVEALRRSPEPHQAPLIRLLVNERNARWPWVTRDMSELPWQLLTDLSRSGTQQQRDFVRIALATPDFALLEGPPGSGKTTTICELILQAARRGQRVLLVASTHVAVDNVLDALMIHEADADQRSVLPVRIGREERVDSERAAQFLVDRREQELRRHIRQHLEADDGALGSAKPFLKQALSVQGKGEDKKNPLLQMLLESANLVCGTNIGFLSFTRRPELQTLSAEPFDFMVLDEASKTTFSEFLVPARFAKRWVVVGDRRQLSPYVDDEEVRGSLDALLDEGDRTVCEDVFLTSSRRHDEARTVVVATEEAALNRYRTQAAAVEATWVEVADADPVDFLRSKLFLGEPAAIRAREGMLPEDTRRIRSDVPLPLLERRRAWTEHTDRVDAMSWGALLSWRLVRSYEMRDDPEQRAHLDEAVDRLMPAWLDEQKAHRVRAQVDDVRRVALPSVLELLQRGFGEQPHQRARVALTHGLGGGLESRMVSLQYQHRMHPDISAFPRDAFYSDTDEQLLLDAEGMAGRRADPWGYRPSEPRAVWRHVQGGDRNNVNEKEAHACIDELRAFLDWAEHVPGPDGNPWSVALLTFYRGQESRLRELLRSLARQLGDGNVTYDRFVFRDRAGRVKAEVSLRTVDRFQGQQADLVILSFVRTGSPGFLTSRQRMNVAITRARFKLVLVGQVQNFAKNKRMPEFLQRLAAEVPVRDQWGAP